MMGGGRSKWGSHLYPLSKIFTFLLYPKNPLAGTLYKYIPEMFSVGWHHWANNYIIRSWFMIAPEPHQSLEEDTCNKLLLEIISVKSIFMYAWHCSKSPKTCPVLATWKNPGVNYWPKKLPLSQISDPKKFFGSPRHANPRVGSPGK